jgi:hypothetical protein
MQKAGENAKENAKRKTCETPCVRDLDVIRAYATLGLSGIWSHTS